MVSANQLNMHHEAYLDEIRCSGTLVIAIDVRVLDSSVQGGS